jgi:carbon-monoxide dehydrogenase large subunit
MTDQAVQPKLLGARVKRREDPRFLTGQGTYVDDVVRPAMLHAAFVRSPQAHADITSIDVSAALELEGVHAVITGEDLADHSRPVVAMAEFEGWQTSEWPALAIGRVRFVGEAVAIVIADDRYLAEDAAEFVTVEYEPLPVLATMDDALADDAAPLHPGWTRNCFLRRHFKLGDPDAAFADADHVATVELRSGRSSGIPLECRGTIAEYDRGQQQLTVWSSNQIPHLLRTAIADFLVLPEHRVRVISPDVGGGFGIKAMLHPEELVVAAAAKIVGRPVKWIEDRQEHLMATMHAREHRHTVDIAYNDDGIVSGLRARIEYDAGAYSAWPWPSSMEIGMAGGILPGQYRIANYECEALAIATNKCFTGAYRGVARPAANFSIERAMDEVAHRLGLDPLEIRRRNYVRPEDFPYTSVTGMIYDSGSFMESLEKVTEQADYAALRERQAQARAEGRYLGIGFASYTEQTAHGTVEWAKRGVEVVPGFDTALVRVDPAGLVTVQVSTHSHGQGHETTIAQIVADELSLPIEQIRVRFGDTDTAPYGHGTFASRSAVMGGGAAMQSAQIVREKLIQFASHLLEVDPDDLELRGGHVGVKGSPGRQVSIAELARWTYHRPEKLPQGMQAVLEGTTSYDAAPGTGTFANAAHLTLVEVDVETGGVDVLAYWVTEDCGTMINPMIIDGQVHGGVAQGLGGALMEEFVYDESGQLTTTTFKDYRLVGTTDVPTIHVSHLETKSANTHLGTKGMGEGGAITPGAAIASAVADALEPLGHVFVNELPLTPERVLRFVADARAVGASSQRG